MSPSNHPLQAYRVQDVLVFAAKGTEAKILAAPRIRPMSEWKEDVAAWVALRAERAPDMDELVEPTAVDPYIHCAR
jgi:hypothetical protein